ncbi:hypothetical protein AAMO2058_000904000 [Amorphochlora amoebiformis]
MSEAAKKEADVISGKLDLLANRFEGFEDDLDAEQSRKIEELNRRFDEVARKIEALDHSLKLESKNNKMSMKALQIWLENRFLEFEKSMAQPLDKRFKEIEARFGSVEASINAVKKTQTGEVEQLKKSIGEVKADYDLKINHFKLQFDDAVDGIAESRKEVQLKLTTQERSMITKLQNERKAREQAERHLTESLGSEEKVRAKGIQLLEEDLSGIEDAFKSSINEERQARIAGDEKLVQAIAHYTAALQDAIRKVAE